MEVLNSDSFIGSKFKNLEVLYWDGARQNGVKVYTVSCSVCSKDTELFGDGLFKTTKHSLTDGKIPCGCAPARKWTQHQYSVLIQRKASTKGYTVSFAGHIFNRSDTEATLSCRSGHTWTTKYKTILAGYGCPHCANAVKVVPDDIQVASFLETGKFKQGTKFWRSENIGSGGKLKWYSTCPTCSNDAFVKAGLCNGVFESDVGMLKKGSLPCRCSKKINWTKEQREHQISEVLKNSTDYKFVAWATEGTGWVDGLVIDCAIHGESIIPSGEFLHKNRRCVKCASHGFKKHLPASVYILSITNAAEEITGFGITNDIVTRLSAHKRELGNAGYILKLVGKLDCTGSEAVLFEKSIKAKFACVDIGVAGFKREATLAPAEDVMEYLTHIYSTQKETHGLIRPNNKHRKTEAACS